jgi:hypothetical protein
MDLPDDYLRRASFLGQRVRMKQQRETTAQELPDASLNFTDATFNFPDATFSLAIFVYIGNWL